MENKDKQLVLSVKDLAVSFKTDAGLVHAVRGVSFDLFKGETLCIVGESGSGKSVTSKTIMGILSANAVIENGSVIYEGEDLTKIDESEFHRIRGHKIGMVFQDPLSSLNPIMKVGKQITEAMLVNSDLMKQKYDRIISKEEAAYKNIEAKRKTAYQRAERLIENFDEDYNKQIYALQSKIKEAFYLASTTNPCENEILLVKEKYAALFKELRAYETSKDEQKLTKEQKAKLSKEVKEKLEKLRTQRQDELTPLLEQTRVAREKAYNEAVEIQSENNKKIKELLAKQKAEHVRVVAEAKKMKKEADVEFNNARPALKAALDAKKKEAKAEIEKYKAEAKAVYDADMAALREKGASKEELEKRTKEYNSLFRISKEEAKAAALKVMAEVGIPQPEVRFNQYPFEFSGGMRQRIVIAIALTANPEVLICDEPTTALDVTIQAQILELINRLKKERNMSVIFISHDLGVVANMADRVAVMYAGKIVEVGTAAEVFYDPKHPYTWALLSSIPDLDSHEQLEAIPGTPPYLLNPPKGDAFAARNKYAMAIDFKSEPPFFKVTDTHYAATWLLDKRAPKAEKPRIVSQRIKASLAREQASKKEEKKNDNGGEQNA